MRLLLDACAKMLETLVLYPADPRGERLSLKGVQALVNDFVTGSSLHDFDLSRSKFSRMINFPASSIHLALNDGSPDAASSFIKYVLSTITSSAFFQVIIVYWDRDFRGVESYRPHLHEMSRANKAEEASRHHSIPRSA